MNEWIASSISKQLEERAKTRKLHFFPVSAFLSPGSSTLTGQVAIRVALKAEEMNAIAQSEAWAKRLGDGEQIRDRDLVTDTKTLAIMHSLVRNGDSEQLAQAFPAFNTPQDMANTLTGPELAKLFNLVEHVARLESPLVTGLDSDTIDTYAATLASATHYETVSMLFTAADRQWLEQFAWLITQRLRDARADLNDAKQIAALPGQFTPMAEDAPE